MSRHNDGWEPRTRLGRKVQNGDISSMEQALDSGLPLKEAEIVDQLLPGLEDEVLDINMVQRMTDSGRRVKFRCVVAVGNRDGYLGYAQARDDQVGGAIQKAIDVAKLNIIEVDRGSGPGRTSPAARTPSPARPRGRPAPSPSRSSPPRRGSGWPRRRQSATSWSSPASKTLGRTPTATPGRPSTSRRRRSTP